MTQKSKQLPPGACWRTYRSGRRAIRVRVYHAGIEVCGTATSPEEAWTVYHRLIAEARKEEEREATLRTLRERQPKRDQAEQAALEGVGGTLTVAGATEAFYYDWCAQRGQPPARELDVHRVHRIRVGCRIQDTRLRALAAALGPDRLLTEVTVFDINRALSTIKQGGHQAYCKRKDGTGGRGSRSLGPSTMDKYRAMIRRFCRWAVRGGYLLEDPSASPHYFESEQKGKSNVLRNRVNVWLEKSELRDWLAAVRLPSCDWEAEAHAFFVVLIFSGCRLGELLSLTWPNVTLIPGQESIEIEGWTSKGRIDRTIPISVSDALAALEYQRLVTEGVGSVFPSMNVWRVTHVVRKVRRTLGWSESQNRRLRGARGNGWSAHDFRHNYASQLVKRGVSLMRVAELLGHSNLQTTRLYAHLAPQDVREDVEKLADLGGVSLSHAGGRPDADRTQTISKGGDST